MISSKHIILSTDTHIRHRRATRLRSRPSSSISIASTPWFWFCAWALVPLVLFVLRLLDPAVDPRSGALILGSPAPSAADGVESSIIIIACLRLTPAETFIGLSRLTGLDSIIAGPEKPDEEGLEGRNAKMGSADASSIVVAATDGESEKDTLGTGGSLGCVLESRDLGRRGTVAGGGRTELIVGDDGVDCVGIGRDAFEVDVAGAASLC